MNLDLGEAPAEAQLNTTSLPANKCWSFWLIQTAVGGTENGKKDKNSSFIKNSKGKIAF